MPVDSPGKANTDDLGEVKLLVERITGWHIAVAAEAFAAGVFARCGYDVSVQYGANQPEYDLELIIVKAPAPKVDC